METQVTQRTSAREPSFIRRHVARLAAAPALVLAAAQLAGPMPAAAPGQLFNTAEVSGTWAGYVANNTAADFTGVAAVIDAPTPGYAVQRTGVVSSWVGIGGYQTDDLIQAGISQEQDGDGLQGWAWYEVLPDTAQPIDMVVNPGDRVTVTVKLIQANQWQINIEDGEQTFQKVLTYTSCRCSAEWIVEAPSTADGQLTPLPSFDQAAMEKAVARVDGSVVNAGELAPTRAVLTDAHGQALASPSPLAAQGAAFRVLTTGRSS
jgi:hypothetical protein